MSGFSRYFSQLLKHASSQQRKEYGATSSKTIKTAICEAVVSKKSFPSLLKKSWEDSVHPENLVSGYRATGIHPENSNAIHREKLKPSIPYAQQSSSLDLPPTATPITTKVTSIFQKQFQAKLAKPVSKGGRLRPNYYGESMTTEEAVRRIQQRDIEREQRRRNKPRPSNHELQHKMKAAAFQKTSAKDV